jgi:membrane protein DedA with SNARE-associated domain
MHSDIYQYLLTQFQQLPPFWLIFVTTFILEDVAIISSLLLIASGVMSFESAFFANYLGIALGDLGVYFLGAVAARILPNWQRVESYRKRMQDSSSVAVAIVASRAIPGTRLPIYLGAGYFSYPFFRFFVLTVLSVLVWVTLALSMGEALQGLFAKHWTLFIVGLISGIYLIRKIFKFIFEPWTAKAAQYSWRKWLHFEFWPAWFFYIPVVIYYFYLALRYRSLYLPGYANPGIRNGGFVGESKWDFLKFISTRHPEGLPSFLVQKPAEVENLILENKLELPFILKPDRGQRGYAVRLIRDLAEVKPYLEEIRAETIAQEFCSWKNEAGILYYRFPTDTSGHIFSITDKTFPIVTGDGITKLGDLILQDPRARVIANVYFSRFQGRLAEVPPVGEIIQLAVCGNHCQGAIFHNGKDLGSPELLRSLDRVAQQIPHFFFGRFDVRYESRESLMKGEGYRIVEVNGAGSEATHIWDPKTKLIDAYATLFKQWRIIFAIGKQARDMGLVSEHVQFHQVVLDMWNAIFEKKNLETSS